MKFYEISVLDENGKMKSLSDYKGKVLLIVNSATECGFTPQYEQLRMLYDKYFEHGFEILDFPCNQFGGQAPGTDREIKDFCVLKYAIPYPIFSKVDVNGDNESLLFKYLKEKKGFEGFNNHKHPLNDRLHEMMINKDPKYSLNSDIKWNFTKFIVSRDGVVIKRFEPVDDMLDVEDLIQSLL